MRMPAVVNKGREVKNYPLDEAAAFLEGAAVILNADGELVEAGADPAEIAGFALHDAGAEPLQDECLIGEATAKSTFFLQGDDDPVEADVGDEMGLIKDADGIWHVTPTDATTTNATVVVEDVDLSRNYYEIRVLDAARQLG